MLLCWYTHLINPTKTDESFAELKEAYMSVVDITVDTAITENKIWHLFELQKAKAFGKL